MDPLHVAEQTLGVGAQRVAHLAEVRDELEPFGAHAVRGGAGVLEHAPGAFLGLGAHRSRSLACLTHDLGALSSARATIPSASLVAAVLAASASAFPADRSRAASACAKRRTSDASSSAALTRLSAARWASAIRSRTRSSVSSRMRSAVSSAAATIEATRSAARAALARGRPLEPDRAFSATPGW